MSYTRFEGHGIYVFVFEPEVAMRTRTWWRPLATSVWQRDSHLGWNLVQSCERQDLAGIHDVYVECGAHRADLWRAPQAGSTVCRMAHGRWVLIGRRSADGQSEVVLPDEAVALRRTPIPGKRYEVQPEGKSHGLAFRAGAAAPYV